MDVMNNALIVQMLIVLIVIMDGILKIIIVQQYVVMELQLMKNVMMEIKIHLMVVLAHAKLRLIGFALLLKAIKAIVIIL